MSCIAKSRSVVSFAIITMLRLATVSCVTTSTTPNSSIPFFPRVGRDYPTAPADYKNTYIHLGDSVNSNPYNNLEHSVNNNAYNTLDNTVNNNAYNTLEYSVNNNPYNTMGNSVNNNAYNTFDHSENKNAYNTLGNNVDNNAHYPKYAQDSQQNTDEYTPRKGYGHYPLYPGHGSPYQPFYYQGGPPAPNCFNENTMVHSLLDIGASKLGTLGFLTQIPHLLVKFLLKFALIKLGFFLFGAPLLLPLILPVLAMYLPYLVNKYRPCCGGNGDDDDDDDGGFNNATMRVRFREGGAQNGGYEQAMGRAVRTLMDAERCYEKMACKLGTANAKSEYNKPIMWILASMVKAGTQEERDRLVSFKEAYTKGVQDKTCGNEIYQCNLGKLVERFK